MGNGRRKNGGSPPTPRWEFPRRIPTLDFFEGVDLDDPGSVGEAVDNFIFSIEEGSFLTWEAVVSQEQGLRLTRRQRDALEGLIDFGDAGDEEILSIDDLPRPSEPWHAILNRIAPHLVVDPFRTFEVHWDVENEGWDRLVECLEEHGEGLSLPAGAAGPLDVVPSELRHRLSLQSCFAVLAGIGQKSAPRLEEDGQRVEAFIGRLRACKESVAHLHLTLDSLFERLILPEVDGQFLAKRLREVLGIRSSQDELGGHL